MMNRGQLPTKQLSDSNWGAFDHASHMHPNYCQITIMCSIYYYIISHIGHSCMVHAVSNLMH